MSAVSVEKVTSRKQMNEFIRFTDELYKDCHQYVPDLHSDVRDTFNPKKNAALQFVQLQPFIAYKDGKVVGRVAAIINPHANEKWKNRVVRFGMIDFIDDREVSRALLDAVAAWGKGVAWIPSRAPSASLTSTRKGCCSPTMTTWAP